MVEMECSTALDSAGARMRVDRRRAAECVTVSVEGEIDLVVCAELDARLAAAERLAAAGEWFVVDLDRVTFLGAAGLRVLVDSQHRCSAMDIRFRVVAARPVVTRPIQLTGLASRLHLEPSGPPEPRWKQ